jgi:hypothetical protein
LGRLALNALADPRDDIGSTQRDNNLTAEDIFRDGQFSFGLLSNPVYGLLITIYSIFNFDLESGGTTR